MKKHLLFLLLFFFSGSYFTVLAQNTFIKTQKDSLWSIWTNTKKADTTRLNALFIMIRKGYEETQPDSTFYYAQLGYDFASKKMLKDQMSKALIKQGISFDLRYNYTKALEYYEKSLLISEEIGNKNGIANSLESIGTFHFNQNNYPEALQYYKRSLTVFEEIDNKSDIAYNLYSIGSVYEKQGDYKLALDYFQKCLKIDEESGDKNNIASSLNKLGEIYYRLGNDNKALNFYQKSLKLYEMTNYEDGISGTLKGIGNIYKNQGDYTKALNYYNRALQLIEKMNNKKYMGSILLDLGNIYSYQEDYPKTLEHYQKGLVIYEGISDKSGTSTALNNIGYAYMKSGNYIKSEEYYNRSLKIREQIGDKRGIAFTYGSLGIIKNKQKNYKEGIIWCEKSFKLAEILELVPIQKTACQCLYDAHKILGNGDKALLYFEKMIELDKQLDKEETVKQLQQMEFKQMMLQDSIAKAEESRLIKEAHQTEVQKKNKTRNVLIGSGLFLLIIAGGLFSRVRYIRKSKAILQVEKDRSENLLHNILPEEIAAELKEKGRAEARDFEMVSILFSDFKGFTEQSAQMTATTLVNEINHCFEAFDGIMEKYNIEKIKTIGDAYMAAGGLPVPNKNSVKNTVLAAIEMQTFIQNRKKQQEREGKHSFEMRVGIHTGPVVAGIVGVKKFQYDIWGDTVNTASRVESNGEVGKVNLSEATYQLLKNDSQFSFESRGKIIAKGKGEMELFFVELKK